MPEDIVVSVQESSADVEIGVGQIQVTTQVQDVANLSDILDVDTSNLDRTTNKYVLVYDAVRNKYIFTNPDSVIDSSVGVSTDDPNPVGMTTATINYLDDVLDNKIDLDAGEW